MGADWGARFERRRARPGRPECPGGHPERRSAYIDGRCRSVLLRPDTHRREHDSGGGRRLPAQDAVPGGARTAGGLRSGSNTTLAVWFLLHYWLVVIDG